MEQLKNKYKKIPEPVRLFFIKAMLLAVVWSFAYRLFLQESLNNFLTNHVGQCTAAVLNRYSGLKGFSSVFDGTKSQIYHEGIKVMFISNGCNALNLMVLYVGLIICIPSKLIRKLYYILIGVVCIDLLNIFRGCILACLKEYYAVYFDFAHHYIFTIVVYTAIILMWLLFTRKSRFRYAIV